MKAFLVSDFDSVFLAPFGLEIVPNPESIWKANYAADKKRKNLFLFNNTLQNWRRGWDLNPRLLSGEPLFESGALSHSATSPTQITVMSFELLTLNS